MPLFHRDRAVIAVIDLQERFRVYDVFDDVVSVTRRLVQGAAVLGVPVMATEQYPKGLGHTVPEVGLGEDVVPVEKLTFSACRAERFDLRRRDQVVLCGIETHVCVSQTALDLLDRGVEVAVAADAVGSRRQIDHDVALGRLQRAGAVVTTVESALLELCGRAGTAEFKSVQRLLA